MRVVLSLILAVSLLGNVVLWLVIRTWEKEPAQEARTASPSIDAGERSAGVAAVDVSRLDPDVVRGLASGDARTLRDLLDACEADRAMTRWMVASLVGYGFQDEKIEAVRRMQGSGWWKKEPSWWEVPEREAIDQREMAAIRALVGDYPRKEDAYPWRVEMLDFLSLEKREALQAVKADYEDIRSKLPPGPWLPHEKALSESLEAEERRDVEALLSAEELAEYDFRRKAENLGRELDKYGVSDAELRAVYRAEEERSAAWRRLEEKYPGYTQDPFASVKLQNPEAVAEATLIGEAYDQRMVEIFGAERLARGDREADIVFRSILELTDKFGAKKQQAEAVYEMLKRANDEVERDDIRDEGWQARRAALRRAALEELERALPPEAVGLLLEQVNSRYYWLTAPGAGKR